MIIHWNK